MYIDRENLKPLCPSKQIQNALDDAGDGDVDALLDALIAAAENKVHAALGPDYPSPLPDPVPAVVTHCASVFAVYELWARNGFKSDDNPRSSDAKDALDMLTPYANGEKKLYADDPDDDNLITEPNSLDSDRPMV
jgi:phage gp36-like protein